jgi:hypothetical protein
MTEETKACVEAEHNGKLDWVKPEVVSFEAVSATEAATANPGDALSSNS